MEIKKIKTEDVNFRPFKVCTVTEMGDVIEVIYSECRNRHSSVLRLSGEEYIYLPSGEIRQYKHGTKLDHKENLYRTFSKIRNIINTNVRVVENCRWLTLTYAENVTDPERLYRDFERFIRRAHRHWGKFEYISVVEPQGRGAWHCHVIVIFDGPAPYMPNEDVFRCWGQGFVRVEAIDKNIDNVGAYLTCYLTDLKLDENGSEKSKAKVKGGRIGMYPAGMRIFRHSRGIHTAPRQTMTWEEAQALVGDATQVYEQAYKISDEEAGFENKICRMQYNRRRK